MQLANVWLKISEQGNLVQLKNVTPAECQVLRRDFGIKIAGTNQLTNCFTHIDVLKEETKRDSTAEFGRLIQKYGQKKVETAFPGENPNIPETFEKAGVKGADAEAPKSGKMHEIPKLTDRPDSGADLEVEDDEVASASKTEVDELKKQIAELTKVVATQKQAVVKAPVGATTAPNK